MLPTEYTVQMIELEGVEDGNEEKNCNSVYFGLAMNETISKFAEMCKEHGGVGGCLRHLLQAKYERKIKYQFKPLTREACDWHVCVDEEDIDIQPLLSELDDYVDHNRFKDRATAIEELLFGITATDCKNGILNGVCPMEHSSEDQSKHLLEADGNEEDDFIDCETERDNIEGAFEDLSECHGAGPVLDVIVCTDDGDVPESKKKRKNQKSPACDTPRCPVCNKNFNSNLHVRNHCRQVHRRHLIVDKDGNFRVDSRELLECDKCDYVALRAGRMSTHRKEAHGIVDSIICDLCDKVFPTHRKRHHHIMQFHTLINAACEICGKICKNRSSFQRHRLCHQRSFKCSYCSKIFSERRSFLQHEKSHISNNLYQCPRCDRGFSQRGNMERHVKVMHLKEGKLVCDFCSYKTFYASTLREHIARVHHGIRDEKFHCELCNKGFTRRLNFEEHMDVHEGRYRYSCEKCGKNYRNRARCRQHSSHCSSRHVHSDELNFNNSASIPPDDIKCESLTATEGDAFGSEKAVYTLTVTSPIRE